MVHLAFVILQAGEATRRVNLEGSRSVFEAAVAASAKRLVYASSVAAYGFHPDHLELLTEDVPARGTDLFKARRAIPRTTPTSSERSSAAVNGLAISPVGPVTTTVRPGPAPVLIRRPRSRARRAAGRARPRPP
ncbi:MAG: NAD-dependent epimerase/dehydratase family protein [Actinomycetota bacterium]|nr:NAD-dependent epimerase/dehydratase family protein [Actinomycetota bacterium]